MVHCKGSLCEGVLQVLVEAPQGLSLQHALHNSSLHKHLVSDSNTQLPCQDKGLASKLQQRAVRSSHDQHQVSCI